MEPSSTRQQLAAGLPSNKSFGLLFALVFVIVASWPLLFGGTLRIWALGVAAAFGAATFLAPAALTPLNRAWMHFGALLHRVTSPVILAILFFAIITPFGIAMRLFGRRPLSLDIERSTDSYWVRREPPGPEPNSIRNQF